MYLKCNDTREKKMGEGKRIRRGERRGDEEMLYEAMLPASSLVR